MPRILAWPMSVVDGRLATVDADGVEAQRQHVAVLMATRPGERVAVPAYGSPDPVGVRDIDEQGIRAVVERWCPQAEITSVETIADEAGTFDVVVGVTRR